MEPHSHFTFVEAGTPNSRRGNSKGSTARSLIRSHAMQQVWEQRRLQRAQDHGDSKVETVENEKLRATRELKPNSLVRTTKATATGMKKIPSRKTPRSNALQLNHRTNSYGGNAQAIRNSSACNSPNAIGMCLMDPFNTCAISLGPKESRYMTHYFQALSWRFTMPKKTWLRYAIHDTGLLHGVLAIAAAHYSFATTRGLSDDALYHHGKTINHVQKCLEDPGLRFSDGVIGSIGRMVVCHLVFGNREHFITHIKALQRSAEARGGLESLGMVGQLKYIIASCVAGAATTSWCENVPSQLKHPYGSLDYPAMDDVPDAGPYDSEWGSAFRELNKIGFLSDALLDICEAMMALNSIISSRRSWDEPQQRLFGDQCNKLSLRLIYLKENEAVRRREMTPRDHMRECVRLAVHFYISAFQRDVPLLSNLSIQILQQLRESLYLTDLEASWGGGQLGEVLLWVMIITASGCVRPQERERAGAQIRKTALQLGVAEWHEAKRICRRFLFLDSVVEMRTWPLWRDYGPRPENEMLPIRFEASILPADERVVVVH